MENRRKGIKGLNTGVKRILSLLSIIVTISLPIHLSDGEFYKIDDLYYCDSIATEKQLRALIKEYPLGEKLTTEMLDDVVETYLNDNIYWSGHIKNTYLYNLSNYLDNHLIHVKLGSSNNGLSRAELTARYHLIDNLIKRYGLEDGCVQYFNWRQFFAELLFLGIIALAYWAVVWIVVWIIDGFRE